MISKGLTSVMVLSLFVLSCFISCTTAAPAFNSGSGGGFVPSSMTGGDDGWSHGSLFSAPNWLLAQIDQNLMSTVLDYGYTPIPTEVPRSFEDHVAEGFAALDGGNYRAAYNAFKKAIELKPDYLKAYYGRGVARAFQKDYKGSITDFNKVISIDPNYVQAYYNRAVSKAIMGNHKDALPDFDIAIKYDPKDAEAFFNRGISRMNVKDTKGGCEDFRKALELGYQPAEQMVKIYCSGSGN